MKGTEKELLVLLAKALEGQSLKDIAIENEHELWKLARRHGVLPFLYEMGEEAGAAATMQVKQFYRLLFATKYYTGLLEQKGVACVVLKGCGAACGYPQEELRKSGDVDILVTDRKKWEYACQLLEERGAVREEEPTTTYHVGYRIPGGITLELHSSFMEAFDHGKANEVMDSMLETLTGQIIHSEVAGVEFPVLRRPYEAISLLVHMLHHFRTGGFGVKLLCDWKILWSQNWDKEDRETYLEWVGRFGLKGFSDLITQTCCRYLGLKPLDGTKGDIREETVEFFMEDIWESGEFGAGLNDRIAVLQDGGPLAYLRELHHQMLLNYPHHQSRPWLWPGLWTLTLFRFVRNNRRIRNVSTWSVLKKTAGRSRYMKEISLFRE